MPLHPLYLGVGTVRDTAFPALSVNMAQSPSVHSNPFSPSSVHSPKKFPFCTAVPHRVSYWSTGPSSILPKIVQYPFSPFGNQPGEKVTAYEFSTVTLSRMQSVSCLF